MEHTSEVVIVGGGIAVAAIATTPDLVGALRHQLRLEVVGWVACRRRSRTSSTERRILYIVGTEARQTPSSRSVAQTSGGATSLDHAVREIPSDRMRLHLCWGNYEGPHTHDVPLRDILDLVLRARPAGLSLEAANPRHGHEWRLFEDVKLPDGKYLVPGVIDSTTNFVEHHQLVAERLVNFARVVGPERVMAGTDCGFSTFASGAPIVATSAVWAKLRALSDGANLASEQVRW